MNIYTISGVFAVTVALVGMIAFFIMLNADEPRKEIKSGVVWVLCICLFFCSFYWKESVIGALPLQTETKQELQNIWTATCPFGIISVEGHGWLYSYSLSYAEIYSLKFVVGNEIITKSFNVNNVKLIYDGTFQLESVSYRYYKLDPYDNSRIVCYPDGDTKSYGSADSWHTTKYTIHIPELPVPKYNTTTWYVGG